MIKLIVGIVGLGLAVYGVVEQRRARAETAKLPDRIAEGVREVLATVPIGREPEVPAPEVRALPPDGDAGGGEEVAGLVGHADINDDGHLEVLVQHVRGLNTSVLKVYGNHEGLPGTFELLGEITNGALSSYQVGDFDGDGRTEIGTLDLDPEAGLPFAASPRLERLYRWNGRRFALVGTGRRWDPAEDPEGREVADYLGEPKWASSM